MNPVFDIERIHSGLAVDAGPKERAAALLHQIMSPEQRKTWESKFEYCDVPGPRLGITYRLSRRYPGITEMDNAARRATYFCVSPYDYLPLPYDDKFIGLLLWLKSGDEGWRRFAATSTGPDLYERALTGYRNS